MSKTEQSQNRSAIVLAPGQGREYPMGRISANFKADGAETDDGYSISEWWLEPNTKGPGAHSHPEDDAFYVIEGSFGESRILCRLRFTPSNTDQKRVGREWQGSAWQPHGTAKRRRAG